MTKKTNGFLRGLAGRRGSIAVIYLAVIAALCLAIVGVFSTTLYRAAADVNDSSSAYYAAWACASGADNLEPFGAPGGSGNVAASCSAGAAVDWTNSTANSIVCANAGTTDTVRTIGGKCSCITQVLTTDGDTTYSTVSSGKCNVSGTRTDDEGAYVVEISKAISKCPTCAQLCPGGPAAPPAVCGDVACNVSCDSCCIPGIANPPCQGGICQP